MKFGQVPGPGQSPGPGQGPGPSHVLCPGLGPRHVPCLGPGPDPGPSCITRQVSSLGLGPRFMEN
jgi:hypothetical protein